jgi:hypothetical protein
VLLVGDTRSAQPLSWALGEVQVLHPPLDDGSQPAAAPYRCWAAACLPAVLGASAMHRRLLRHNMCQLPAALYPLLSVHCSQTFPTLKHPPCPASPPLPWPPCPALHAG